MTRVAKPGVIAGIATAYVIAAKLGLALAFGACQKETTSAFQK
jgi:hypothetical protein